MIVLFVIVENFECGTWIRLKKGYFLLRIQIEIDVDKSNKIVTKTDRNLDTEI